MFRFINPLRQNLLCCCWGCSVLPYCLVSIRHVLLSKFFWQVQTHSPIMHTQAPVPCQDESNSFIHPAQEAWSCKFLLLLYVLVFVEVLGQLVYRTPLKTKTNHDIHEYPRGWWKPTSWRWPALQKGEMILFAILFICFFWYLFRQKITSIPEQNQGLVPVVGCWRPRTSNSKLAFPVYYSTMVDQNEFAEQSPKKLG